MPNIQNLAFITDKKFHQKYANSEDVRIPYIKLLDSDGGYPLTAMGDGIMRLLQIILKIFSASLWLVFDFVNSVFRRAGVFSCDEMEFISSFFYGS